MAAVHFKLFLLGITLSMASAENPTCSTGVDEGTGEESTLQYFYNGDMGKCLPFFYRGLGGNDNRFTTDEACMKTCSPGFNEVYPAGDAVCSLPVDHGSCFALLLMYYYNAEEKNCRIFHYGGCQGNGNRFESREQCQEMCMPARSGRLGGAMGGAREPIPNPDVSTTDAGLIVGILGGVVFTVAVIAGIVVLVKRRKQKDSRGEREAVPDIEMN